MDDTYHWTDNLLSDPYEDERRQKEHHDMLGFVADAQYGIPTKCPCGESIKHDVTPTPKFKRDFDTQPGSRYFTCTKYKDNGLHFRQPWVFGIEEEISKLQRKVEQQSVSIALMRLEIQQQAQEIAKLKEK